MVHQNGNFSYKEKNLNLLGTKGGVSGDFRLGKGKWKTLVLLITLKSFWNLG